MKNKTTKQEPTKISGEELPKRKPKTTAKRKTTKGLEVMKTVKELRIGNWLLNINNKQIVKVRQIRFGELLEVYHTEKITGYVTLEYLQPIPLTEELLLKCGFISNPYEDRYEMCGIHIECNKLRGYLELWESRTGVEINNLHELQNLYYALTKTELKIEL